MLCILGSGAQARSHEEALKHVRSFSEVLYCGPSWLKFMLKSLFHMFVETLSSLIECMLGQ